LLEERAVESGELGVDGVAASAPAPRTKHGKRSLGDRNKDAIS
jgi:hypothetical protein